MSPVVLVTALALLAAPLAAGQSAPAVPATTPAAGTAQPPQAAAPTLPPAATGPIDFRRDITPILTASCVRCHGRGRAKGGFSLESREALLKGGDSGSAVTVGDSAESYLIALVAALDPDEVMPKKGTRLNAAQVGLLRAWIDQGAAWDPAVSFAKVEPRNLHPGEPQMPDFGMAVAEAEAFRRLERAKARTPEALRAAAAATTDGRPLISNHSIDRHLSNYARAHKVTLTPIVDDRTFARRVYFDLIGLPPSPAELRAFLAARGADKRARLVESLLADDRRYAEHWLSFWNDALRNDYRGPGYIDGGREQITAWLYDALRTNLRYDQFVARLVNPVAGSGAEGFTKGIVWRGVVNASQTPPMQAAQNISQVFMGVNLKCASCHDSFINDWQLADAYGLASVYAEGPLEMVECDRPTGRRAKTSFLYPTLGTIDGDAPRAARIQQLSDVLTSARNGRLSRTIVNRLWARLMGRGLVEPVDDMEQPAWSQTLLDWLAEDLVRSGYDLKRTLASITTSQAYQRAAVDLPEQAAPTSAGNGHARDANDAGFVFRGPAIRRLSAEQFVDAVSSLTGIWQEAPDKGLQLTLAPSHGTARAPNSARAALVAADPLMTALGRPTREQVTTTRSAAATTLQALELTNGATLTDMLRAGAARLIADKPTTSVLVTRVYRRALGRAPTAAESRLARQLLGPAPRAEAVEDLLWSIVMLPEFQLLS